MCITITPSNKYKVYSEDIKKEALYLKSQGATRREICDTLKIASIYTLRDWIRKQKSKICYNTNMEENDELIDFNSLSHKELIKVAKELEFKRNCEKAVNDLLKKELGLTD